MKGAKGESRKQELLNIAYQMFIQKGYEETSIDAKMKKWLKKWDSEALGATGLNQNHP